MDQGKNDQRKRGAVDKANDLVRTGRSAYKWGNRAYKAGRAVVVAAEGIAAGGWAVIIVVAVILIFVFIIVLVGGGGGAGGVGLGDQGDTGGFPGGGGSPPSSGEFASCPVPGGTILSGSYQADPVGGHCSPGYPASCLTNSRRAKSIDVDTGGPSGENVVLPSVEGEIQEWLYVNKIPNTITDCTDPADGTCGSSMIFFANGENGTWTLHLVHMGQSSLELGKIYTSGIIAGKTSATHVHISLGKNITNSVYPPPGGTDTDPGWIAVDKEYGMCAPPGSNAGGYCEEGRGYCSVSYLQNYFTDPSVAANFSIICNRESGGQIRAINDSCLDPNGTLDYSGGLFQVNLLAHSIEDKNGELLLCYNAFRRASVFNDPACADNIPNPPSYCLLAQASPGDSSVFPCRIADDNLLKRCEEAVLDPQTNIKRAVKLYNDAGYSPWAAAGACNIP